MNNAVNVILLIVLAGLLFWLIERFVPMNNVFQIIFRVAALIIAVYLLLALFGLASVPVRLI